MRRQALQEQRLAAARPRLLPLRHQPVKLLGGLVAMMKKLRQQLHPHLAVRLLQLPGLPPPALMQQRPVRLQDGLVATIPPQHLPHRLPPLLLNVKHRDTSGDAMTPLPPRGHIQLHPHLQYLPRQQPVPRAAILVLLQSGLGWSALTRHRPRHQHQPIHQTINHIVYVEVGLASARNGVIRVMNGKKKFRMYI